MSEQIPPYYMLMKFFSDDKTDMCKHIYIFKTLKVVVHFVQILSLTQQHDYEKRLQ